MRLALLLLLFGTGVLCAQESDERMARILKPDLNSTANYAGKSFYGGSQFSSQTSAIKPFYISNFFSAKKFQANTYSAGKFWAGDFYQGNAKANTSGKYEIPNAGQTYGNKSADVKSAPVKTAPEAGKSENVQDYAGNRPYLVPGKSQKSLNQQQTMQKNLSVDDVRELLNKNR